MSPMIRATLRLRNDNMISAREHRRFSQKDVAVLAGVPLPYVGAMEKMDFDFPQVWERVNSVAAVLEISPFEIMPEGMAGKVVPSTFVKRMPMDLKLLDSLMHRYRDRFTLPSPQDAAEQAEAREIIDGFKQELPYTQRKVLRLRDAGMTLEEVGRAFNITQERVRQIEAKAKRKLELAVKWFNGDQERKERALADWREKESEWEGST